MAAMAASTMRRRRASGSISRVTGSSSKQLRNHSNPWLSDVPSAIARREVPIIWRVGLDEDYVGVYRLTEDMRRSRKPCATYTLNRCYPPLPPMNDLPARPFADIH